MGLRDTGEFPNTRGEGGRHEESTARRKGQALLTQDGQGNGGAPSPNTLTTEPGAFKPQHKTNTTTK